MKIRTTKDKNIKKSPVIIIFGNLDLLVPVIRGTEIKLMMMESKIFNLQFLTFKNVFVFVWWTKVQERQKNESHKIFSHIHHRIRNFAS